MILQNRGYPSYIVQLDGFCTVLEKLVLMQKVLR